MRVGAGLQIVALLWHRWYSVPRIALMAGSGTRVDSTTGTNASPMRSRSDLEVLGKNGINIYNLRQPTNWLPLPSSPSSNTTFYTSKSYAEPPEQRLIPGSSSRFCIAYAFVHRWQDSERLVSWITGDVASFQGAKFTVLLALYDLNGEQSDVVLLARVGGESRQKEGKVALQHQERVIHARSPLGICPRRRAHQRCVHRGKRAP